VAPDRFEISTELRHTLRVLRRQAWIIVLCVVVAAGVAYAVAAHKRPVYKATAQLLIQADSSPLSLPNTPSIVQDPTRARATALALVTIPGVAARAYAQAHARDTAASVATSSPGDSDIVQITASDHYRQEAAAVANAFANQYIEFRSQANAARFRSAAAVIRSKLTQVTAASAGHPTTPAHQLDVGLLRSQINRLNLEADTQTGDAQLIQQADVPGGAAPDHPIRYGLLGALFGLLLGLALAFLRERLQNRIAREEDLADLAPGIPVIGYVPGARGRGGLAHVGEGIQSLATSLDAISPNGAGRSLLVTSATAQDGKSTTAVNLALALGERQESVLLVEADLRRPKLASMTELDKRRPGLSGVLAGKATLADARQEASFEPARGSSGQPHVALRGDLPVVAAGPSSQKPHTLINERSVAALLSGAREQAENVVVDGPPIGVVADMLPFARQVDGVVVVVRLDHTRPRQLRRLVAQLKTAGVTPLGMVVIGAESPDYYS
jgi:capsular exopolysaccharide synthesis family protein